MKIILIVSLAVIALALLLFLGSVLYFWKGWFHIFYHNVMGWHTPSKNRPFWEEDAYGLCAKCKWCGKKITRDSQGNWFVLEDYF